MPLICLKKVKTMRNKDIVVVIPARYGSSRFPGKPLADICGEPMVVRVAQRARLIRGIDTVVVATDDDRIARVVKEKGFFSIMTSPEHPSGTDRIAEAAQILGLSPEQIVVNVQGDQPMLDVSAVDNMVDLLISSKDFVMTTVACPMDGAAALDPNRVKVVLDEEGRALYFSRSPIPYDRDGIGKQKQNFYLRHLGLYCYRVEFLKQYVTWPEGQLEAIEKLEQLRVLEKGLSIGVTVVDDAPPEVDTKEDLERVRRLFLAPPFAQEIF